jgi:hypothetical protein
MKTISVQDLAKNYNYSLSYLNEIIQAIIQLNPEEKENFNHGITDKGIQKINETIMQATIKEKYKKDYFERLCEEKNIYPFAEPIIEKPNEKLKYANSSLYQEKMQAVKQKVEVKHILDKEFDTYKLPDKAIKNIAQSLLTKDYHTDAWILQFQFHLQSIANDTKEPLYTKYKIKQELLEELKGIHINIYVIQEQLMRYFYEKEIYLFYDDIPYPLIIRMNKKAMLLADEFLARKK